MKKSKQKANPVNKEIPIQQKRELENEFKTWMFAIFASLVASLISTIVYILIDALWITLNILSKITVAFVLYLLFTFVLICVLFMALKTRKGLLDFVRSKRNMIVKLCLIVAFVFVIITISFVIYSDNSSTFWLKKGQKYYQDNDLKNALDCYSKSIKIDGDNAVTYFSRGVVYEKTGKSDEAIRDFDQAIKIKRNFIDAYNHKGDVLGKNRNYEDAIFAYSDAIEKDPNNTYALTKRATLFIETDRYCEAIEDLDRAISIDSNDYLAYEKRGTFYFKKGDYRKAISDFTKVLDIKPDDISILRMRGISCNETNELTTAEKDFGKIRSIDSSNSAACDGLGFIYNKRGDFRKAIDILTLAIDYDKNNYVAYNNRGYSYLKLKSYDLALADLRDSISINPNYDAPYYNRYSVLFDLGKGKTKEALNDIDMAKKLDPELKKIRNISPYDIDEYERKENRARKEDRLLDKVRAISDAISSDPGNVQNYISRSFLYLHLGMLDGAEQDLKRIIERLDPYNAEAYFLYGNYYAYKKNYKEALLNLGIALKLDNSLSYAYSNMASIYNECHDYDTALIMCEEAFKIDSKNGAAYNEYAYATFSKLWEKQSEDVFDKKSKDELRTNTIPKLNLAICYDPDYISYCNRAIIYARIGDFESAILDCNNAIKEYPDNAFCYLTRARIYNMFDTNSDEFERNCEKALEIKPDFAEVYFLEGFWYSNNKDYKKGKELIDKATSIKKDYFRAYVTKAYCEFMLKQYETAIASCDTALGSGKLFAREVSFTYFVRGLSYYAVGKKDLAMDDVGKACSLGAKEACDFFIKITTEKY
jgi:tetratricopeptide (TPR) repeat protein